MIPVTSHVHHSSDSQKRDTLGIVPTTSWKSLGAKFYHQEAQGNTNLKEMGNESRGEDRERERREGRQEVWRIEITLRLVSTDFK